MNTPWILNNKDCTEKTFFEFLHIMYSQYCSAVTSLPSFGGGIQDQILIQTLLLRFSFTSNNKLGPNLKV